MKNLYRRYRPLTLSEIVGQEQVTGPLSNALKQGKISHAYLFIGPRGCGKTSVARILAHEVNGFKYELEDDYVDIIEIDGASNRGIDNIRELREKVAIAPTAGKYKVYIIDEVHMLTKEAFNALLKTLEEPPEHAIFIMATTDAYKVPVTITSRAQTYTFKLADAETMQKHLKSIAKQEKIKITDDAIALIVKRGGGSYRDSLSLLDQISTLSDKEITKDDVIKALGLPEDEIINKLLENYLANNFDEVCDELKKLLNSGVKPETIAEEIISLILEKPSAGLLKLLSKLPEVKAPFAEAKLLVALATENLSPAPKPVMTAAPTVSKAPKPVAAPAKVEKPTATSKPAATPEPVTPVAHSDFDFDGYLKTVTDLNDAIGSQLKKCAYEFIGNELHLFPARNVTKTILSRDNNKQILLQAGQGIKITIHNAGEKPGGTKEDGLLSKISDIMGGEVRNDGGENPF